MKCDESLCTHAANCINSTKSFDEMNSRIPNASVTIHCGYGLRLSDLSGESSLRLH